jgi:hypothetical protein
MQSTMHVYEVRPRKDKRGVDLISDVLPFGRLWYGEPDAVANAAILFSILYKLSLDILPRSFKDLEWHKGKKTRHRRHLTLLPQGPASH